SRPDTAEPTRCRPWEPDRGGVLGGLVLLYGISRASGMRLLVPAVQWSAIVWGVGATLLRVVAALLLTMAWTIPVGVATGTKPRLAAWLQPLAQIAASVPATALFPVFVLVVLHLPGGMQLAAVLLMLMGTQWYVLFNVIAGATAIPQDLQSTDRLLQLSRLERWSTLLLPDQLPYIITRSVTALDCDLNVCIDQLYFTYDLVTLSIL